MGGLTFQGRRLGVGSPPWSPPIDMNSWTETDPCLCAMYTFIKKIIKPENVF